MRGGNLPVLSDLLTGLPMPTSEFGLIIKRGGYSEDDGIEGMICLFVAGGFEMGSEFGSNLPEGFEERIERSEMNPSMD